MLICSRDNKRSSGDSIKILTHKFHHNLVIEFFWGFDTTTNTTIECDVF